MAFTVLVMGTAPASAGDWPQILGPHRNGIGEKETLAETWPASGPKTLWSHAVGDGFAGVAVAVGKAVVFHRVGGSERVESLDAATGKPLWKKDFPATFQPAFVEDNGPRATPLIHKEHIYTYGAMGELRCLELATGNVVWERDTFEDYNSKRPFRGEPPEGYFGIGSTPLVVDDKLIVNVGGDSTDAGMVAFALKEWQHDLEEHQRAGGLFLADPGHGEQCPPRHLHHPAQRNFARSGQWSFAVSLSVQWSRSQSQRGEPDRLERSSLRHRQLRRRGGVREHPAQGSQDRLAKR